MFKGTGQIPLGDVQFPSAIVHRLTGIPAEKMSLCCHLHVKFFSSVQ